MKEYWKKFKEFRKDPKKKSISLLIIYGIFFIFVFIYIKSGNKVTPPVNNNINQNINESTNKENIVTSYEYSYNIKINENIIELSGVYFNGQNEFKIDEKYTTTDNSIKINDYQIKVDTLNKLEYNNLKSFLDKYNLNSRKTEYNDNTIKYEYEIPNNEFSAFLEEENNTDGKVIIDVIEKKYIEKVNINLKDYYNMDNYIISIEYENINNIKKIENNIN